jgi:hypothetical protein
MVTDVSDVDEVLDIIVERSRVSCNAIDGFDGGMIHQLREGTLTGSLQS